ncbi:hypothetical protein HNY73_001537 [Argiope bruennichi]|uniref:Uncharacterized protein n=1 Tax=Argiope bruennichi TaxID=94029 RepID=A0A8T0G2T9_ARGBR|nr:hypothetical protein HNY73_001537 [Argiope bruennichi]
MSRRRARRSACLLISLAGRKALRSCRIVLHQSTRRVLVAEVSLDPRPVVIPILSSVIGFPIVVFALICALRHRAMKLRRRDQLKKLQSGIRSVTLDIPPREKISFFSGGSSPEISMKDVGDRMESTQTTFAGATTSLGPKSSILQTTTRRNTSTSKNNNHVKFVTPASTLEASHTMKVDVVLHQIATCAAESIGADIRCKSWHNGESPPLQRIETGIELESESPKAESPR